MNCCCKYPFKWQPWMGLPATQPCSNLPEPEPTCNPVAGFDTNPAYYPAGEGGPPSVDLTNNFDITFTNTSTDAVSYSWDFGDGTTSNAENPPMHTYDIDSGSGGQFPCGTAFTVILTAYCEANQQGPSDTFTIDVFAGCQ